MAENRNIELNDKIMANATGGEGEASLPAKYSVGDRVICPQRPDYGTGTVLKVYYDEETWSWYYDVQFHDFALEPGFIYDGMINEALALA